MCARASVFLPARVSMAEPLRLKHNLLPGLGECVAAFVLASGVCACVCVLPCMFVHSCVCAWCVCSVCVDAVCMYAFECAVCVYESCRLLGTCTLTNLSNWCDRPAII